MNVYLLEKVLRFFPVPFALCYIAICLLQLPIPPSLASSTIFHIHSLPSSFPYFSLFILFSFLFVMFSIQHIYTSQYGLILYMTLDSIYCVKWRQDIFISINFVAADGTLMYSFVVDWLYVYGHGKYSTYVNSFSIRNINQI